MNPQQPNHFELTGHDMHIVYDVTTFAGQPQLQYRSGQENQTFQGDDIRTAKHDELGTLVSVTISRTVDTGWTALTLIVPQVNLTNNNGEVHTEAIITTHRLVNASPNLIQGQVDSYRAVSLHGKASLVEP